MSLSIFSHIRELKYRVAYIFLSFCCCFFVSLLYSEFLMFFYVYPLLNLTEMQGKHLIFTEMSEAFSTYILLCLFSTLYFLLPYCFYQFWCFLIPSTYYFERSQIKLFSYFFLVIVFFSCFFVYNYFLPEIWSFFLHFEKKGYFLNLELEARISSYIHLTFQIICYFFLLFQVPIFTHLALEFSILQVSFLVSSRKYIYFLFIILAAIISPPDISSQIFLFFLFFFVFEFCIFYSFFFTYFHKIKYNGND